MRGGVANIFFFLKKKVFKLKKIKTEFDSNLIKYSVL